MTQAMAQLLPFLFSKRFTTTALTGSLLPAEFPGPRACISWLYRNATVKLGSYTDSRESTHPVLGYCFTVHAKLLLQCT